MQGGHLVRKNGAGAQEVWRPWLSTRKYLPCARTALSCHLPPLTLGLLGGASGKEPACQCRKLKRHRFNPWVRKIPWRRAWPLTPVFLPGASPWTEKPGGPQSMGVTESEARLKGLAQHSSPHLAKCPA